MPDQKFVRVYIKESQTEKTVPADYAKAVGLKPLAKDAVNKHGRPLPDKKQVDLAGEPVDKADENGEPAEADQSATPKTAADKGGKATTGQPTT